MVTLLCRWIYPYRRYHLLNGIIAWIDPISGLVSSRKLFLPTVWKNNKGRKMKNGLILTFIHASLMMTLISGCASNATLPSTSSEPAELTFSTDTAFPTEPLTPTNTVSPTDTPTPTTTFTPTETFTPSLTFTPTRLPFTLAFVQETIVESGYPFLTDSDKNPRVCPIFWCAIYSPGETVYITVEADGSVLFLLKQYVAGSLSVGKLMTNLYGENVTSAIRAHLPNSIGYSASFSVDGFNVSMNWMNSDFVIYIKPGG
jgi:hypothetical protein